MTTMTDTHTSEADLLDEAAIAAAAAEFSARLDALTARTVEVTEQAQVRFDTDGLPRGLMPLSHL